MLAISIEKISAIHSNHSAWKDDLEE